MSFTTDLKKEIIAQGLPASARRSALAAFLHTSGNVGLVEGKLAFYFVSETENVAEFFMNAFFEEFQTELFVSHATKDRLSGKAKLVIECPPSGAENAAKGLGLIKRTGELRDGIASRLLADEEGKIGYILGAFLGGGSCTIPAEGGKTGYHLEFVLGTRVLAKGLLKTLEEFELIGKLVQRKESFVVYIKSKEQIADFLGVLGVRGSLKRLTAIMDKRDKANNDNRTRNCMAGNADKAAIAAVAQIVAIDAYKKKSGYTQLSEELRAVANARVANPTYSLQELANALGVSKSCLNHRMRKLMELCNAEKE